MERRLYLADVEKRLAELDTSSPSSDRQSSTSLNETDRFRKIPTLHGTSSRSSSDDDSEQMCRTQRRTASATENMLDFTKSQGDSGSLSRTTDEASLIACNSQSVWKKDTPIAPSSAAHSGSASLDLKNVDKPSSPNSPPVSEADSSLFRLKSRIRHQRAFLAHTGTSLESAGEEPGRNLERARMRATYIIPTKINLGGDESSDDDGEREFMPQLFDHGIGSLAKRCPSTLHASETYNRKKLAISKMQSNSERSPDSNSTGIIIRREGSSQESNEEARHAPESVKFATKVGRYRKHRLLFSRGADRHAQKKKRTGESRRKKMPRLGESLPNWGMSGNLRNVIKRIGSFHDSNERFEEECCFGTRDGSNLNPEVVQGLNVPLERTEGKLSGNSIVKECGGSSLQQMQPFLQRGESEVLPSSPQVGFGLWRDQQPSIHHTSETLTSHGEVDHLEDFDESSTNTITDKQSDGFGQHEHEEMPARFEDGDEVGLLIEQKRGLKAELVKARLRDSVASVKLKAENTQKESDSSLHCRIDKKGSEEEEEMLQIERNLGEKINLNFMHAGREKCFKVENQKRVTFKANVEVGKEPSKGGSFIECYDTQLELGEIDCARSGDAVRRLKKYRVKPLVNSKGGSSENYGVVEIKQQRNDLNGDLTDSRPGSSLLRGPSMSRSPCDPSLPLSHYIQKLRSLSPLTRSSPVGWSLYPSLCHSDCQSFDTLSDGGIPFLDQYPVNASIEGRVTFSNPVFDIDSTPCSKSNAGSSSKAFLDTIDTDDQRLKTISRGILVASPVHRFVGRTDKRSWSGMNNKSEESLGSVKHMDSSYNMSSVMDRDKLASRFLAERSKVEKVTCEESMQDKKSDSRGGLCGPDNCSGEWHGITRHRHSVSVTERNRTCSLSVAQVEQVNPFCKSVADLHCVSRSLADRMEFQGGCKRSSKSTEESRYEDNLSFSPMKFFGGQLVDLERRMGGLQKSVMKMRDSIQNLSSPFWVESHSWKGRVEDMEKELDVLKLQTNARLLELKQIIKDDVKKKLDKLTNELGKAENSCVDINSDDKQSRGKVKRNLEECTMEMDYLKQQVDSWLLQVHLDLMKGVEEIVAESMKNFSDAFKSDVEKLELQRSRDLDSLRRDMATWLDSFEGKDLTISKEKKLEVLVEANVEKQLSQFVEILSVGKEKVVAEMKNELAFLRVEVDALFNGREEVQRHIELMTQLAEEVRNGLDRGHSCLDFQSAPVKKQLQTIKNDGLQARLLVEDFKHEINIEIEDMRQFLESLKKEISYIREETLALRKLADLLMAERANMKKLVEKMEEDAIKRKEELEAFRQAKEELEKGRSGARDEAVRERTLIIGKVESLSHQYLGGLEEFRADFLNFKLNCRGRLQELERHYAELRKKPEDISPLMISAKEVSLDSLETRISNLEKESNCRQALTHGKVKAEQILAIIQKDQELAMAAAADATTSAHKAEDLLTKILGSVNSEMASLKTRSTKLQESLVSERDAAVALVSAVRKVNEELSKEKGIALAAILETRRKNQEFQEDLKREVLKLKSTLTFVEKEKESFSSAVSDAFSSIGKAKEVLDEMLNAKRESMELVEVIVLELNNTKWKSIELAEEVVAEMANTKRKSIDLTQEIVAEMAKMKEKGTELIHEVIAEMNSAKWESMHLRDTAIAKIAALADKAEEMLADINHSKKKSFQLQEAALSEAASWRVCAEEILEEMTNAKLKTLEFQKRTTADAAALATKIEEIVADTKRKTVQLQETTALESKALVAEADEVLTELINARTKCMQLLDGIHEVAGNVSGVQDRFNQEIEKLIVGWTNIMHTEATRVGFVNVGPEDVMRKASSAILERSQDLGRAQMSEDLGQNNNEMALSHLTKTLREPADSKDVSVNDIGNEKGDKDEMQQEQMKKDADCLNEKLETLSRMFEALFHPISEGHQSQFLERENSDLSQNHLNSQMKIWEVENKQLDAIPCIDAIQASNSNVERPAASKYKAAARVLKGEERTLGDYESLVRPLDSPENMEKRKSETAEKEHLLSMCRDVSGITQDIGRQSSQEREQVLHSIDIREMGIAKSPETRMITLESRIEHVASATYTNLRILDAKVEHISIGVQTALEGAAMAESKCTALGAELVKVFRMLANSSRGGPAKPSDGSKMSEVNRIAGVRYNGKASLLPPSVNYKKSSVKNPIGSGDSLKGNEASDAKGQGDKKSSTWLRFCKDQGAEGQTTPQTSFAETDGKLDQMSMGKREKQCTIHCQKPSGSSIGLKPAYSSLQCNFEAGEAVNDVNTTENFSTKDEMPIANWKQCAEVSLETSYQQCMDAEMPGRCELGKGELDVQNNVPCKRTDEKRVNHEKQICRSNPAKRCQTANIRLDSERIHVNVSHRSRVMSGTRPTRKVDPFD